MNERELALDIITGCLSVSSVSDTDRALGTVISSGRLDWQVLIDFADAHLLTPALWVAIRRRGLAGGLPSTVREYLWKIHLLSVLRNRRLKDQAISVVRVLNSIGIEPVLLKGGAFLFDKTFGDPSSRVMADLDMLVPREHADHCWGVLRSKGYDPIGGSYDYSRHHHLMPLLHSEDEGTIEIHREALPSSAAAIMPSTLVWKHAQSVRESGVVFHVPDPTTRILHNVLHATLVNRGYARGDISLRSLHELALIQTQCGTQIDWMTIRTLMDRGGKATILNAWLYAAHRLFACPLPDGVRPTHRAVAHYARTRLQVRWRRVGGFIEKAMWFSTRDVCERYQSNEDVISVAKGRMRLAASLSRRGAVNALRWWARATGQTIVARPSTERGNIGGTNHKRFNTRESQSFAHANRACQDECKHG